MLIHILFTIVHFSYYLNNKGILQRVVLMDEGYVKNIEQ